jgi:cyclohexanone monooxygenase
VLDLSEEELESELEALWTQGGTPILWHFADVRRNPESNRRVANFVRRKIRETVEDAAVAEQLTPTDHPFGTKRPCFDSNYFQTFNRPNVDLVDLRRTPLERITPAGVRTSDGEHPLDVLIFALGFDAFTGGFFNMNIHGRDVSLREAWAGGARSYLGLATSGFPNLFMVGGPLGPLVFTAALTTLEQDVEWIADCMAYMEQRGVASIEATPDAEDRWVDTVNSEVSHTLYPLAKGSWYFGANIPGKPRAILGYLGGLHTHRRLCNGVATNGYEGFSLTTERGV